ncbi:MAG: FAD-dependent oxidoreductase [Nocardioides sp.]|nr:FAD-dependent oxidoreductase [Nocardioides sp.]
MREDDGPGRVAVVGAGMLGLATAWFLQRRGVEVTVLERHHVAAGASWGNAGWLTPGLATPLPEPAVLRYGVRALLDPASPVYVPFTADRDLLRFLASFTRHSTATRWRRAMAALIPLNERALPAFDLLAESGAMVETREAIPLLAAYRTPPEMQGLLEELDHLRAAGQRVEHDLLTGDQARELAPSLSGEIGAAIRLHGQRFVDAGAYVQALAAAFRLGGGTVREGVEVTEVRPRGNGVTVVGADGARETFDRVVLATGAGLGGLAREFGVRRLVLAGRGYSFSVPVDPTPTGPIYFPRHRVACTPLGDRLRVAGMMELRGPDAPLDRRRIAAIVAAVRPLLSGVDLDARTDEWVGSRPCTPDGLPLVGVTASPQVWTAGGHGMWGITLGPVTGQLLAEAIVTGRTPPELTPLDPLR